MFTTAHYLSIFWATCINPLLYILISSSHVGLRFQSFLFSSGFPTRKPGGISLILHTWYMLCPSHPPCFYHPNNIWRGIPIKGRLNMQFSPTSFTSFTLQPNTFLPFLKHLCFSVNSREVKFRSKVFITKKTASQLLQFSIKLKIYFYSI